MKIEYTTDCEYNPLELLVEIKITSINNDSIGCYEFCKCLDCLKKFILKYNALCN